LIRFGGDGAEEAQLVFLQQFDRAIGKCIALVTPAIPSDIGRDVLGVEADSFENTDGFRENLVADAIARHADYGMFHHECFVSLMIALDREPRSTDVTNGSCFDGPIKRGPISSQQGFRLPPR